jgi:hypothetical protein
MRSPVSGKVGASPPAVCHHLDDGARWDTRAPAVRMPCAEAKVLEAEPHLVARYSVAKAPCRAAMGSADEDKQPVLAAIDKKIAGKQDVQRP